MLFFFLKFKLIEEYYHLCPLSLNIRCMVAMYSIGISYFHSLFLICLTARSGWYIVHVMFVGRGSPKQVRLYLGEFCAWLLSTTVYMKEYVYTFRWSYSFSTRSSYRLKAYWCHYPKRIHLLQLKCAQSQTNSILIFITE